jgi:chromosome segregation ATPase
LDRISLEREKEYSVNALIYISYLREQISILDKGFNTLKRERMELIQLTTTASKSLQKTRKDSQNEIVQQKKNSVKQEAVIRKNRDKIQKQQDEIKQQKQEIAQYQDKIQKQQDEIKQQKQEIAQYQDEIQKQQDEINQQNQEVEKLKEQLNQQNEKSSKVGFSGHNDLEERLKDKEIALLQLELDMKKLEKKDLYLLG